MILDADIKTQLSQYLQLMENDILLKVAQETITYLKICYL